MEKRARHESIRVIVSEFFMVVAVIITVIILALIVSGYWLNSDFKVERQGLLQISSVPTGANIEIDGSSSWMQRTNTNKVLSSGEHTITLTKEDYDTWTRKINISEGLLYRVDYPRLFLKEREKEAVYDATGTTFATISPDRNSLLLANKTTSWELINLNSDKPEAKTVDISIAFSFISKVSGAKTGLFSGNIISAEWDSSNEHILFKVGENDRYEWVLLNIKNPSESINLSKLFDFNFSEIKIFDNSANTLVAILDGNLRKIDVGGRQLSAIIAENVMDYDFFNSEIVFSAKSINVDDPKYYVGITKIGGGDIDNVYASDNLPKVLFSQFYDNKYITIIENDLVAVYKKDDFSEFFSGKISFTPSKYKIGQFGEFIIMSSGDHLAALDMEALTISEWQAASNHFGWLDGAMIYAVSSGELSVYDFDGLNHRKLSANVSERLPVTITSDKWLYYFSDDQLTRELISR